MMSHAFFNILPLKKLPNLSVKGLACQGPFGAIRNDLYLEVSHRKNIIESYLGFQALRIRFGNLL